MDFEKVRQLIDLVGSSQIHELELEDGDVHIKIVRVGDSVQAIPVNSRVHTMPNQAQPSDQSSNHHQVKSPLVGTFYRAPSPESLPFVEVGDKVEVGQTLCIVEAMKVMNEIESDAVGTVVKILVENQQPIEAEQALFLIDTSQS